MGDVHESKIVDCECYSLDHILRFTLDTYSADDKPELAVAAHLSTWLGFWNRLWNGMKYILGFKQRHGNWDEVCIRFEQAKELRAMLDRYISLSEAWGERMIAKQAPVTDPGTGGK